MSYAKRISLGHGLGLDFFSMNILLVIFILAALSIIIWTVRNGISPMPTTAKVMRALKGMLPEIHAGTIVELGSGWGHVALMLAREYPHLQVIGYETSPIPYYCSCLLKKVSCQKNLCFVRSDFFNEPFEDVSLAVCYLYPNAMARLKEKFANKKLFVLTHTFSIPGWIPSKTLALNDMYRTHVFLYDSTNP